MCWRESSFAAELLCFSQLLDIRWMRGLRFIHLTSLVYSYQWLCVFCVQCSLFSFCCLEIGILGVLAIVWSTKKPTADKKAESW